MRIDKSKFTAEELAQYEKLIAKAAVPEKEKDGAADESSKESGKAEKEICAEKPFHGSLKKTQERIEYLEKSLEMKELQQVAEKYEIIGEKPKELAKTLYELKKSNENSYAAYLATLDKALSLVQKSGLFIEIGKASHDGETGGGAVDKIQAVATELQKANPTLSQITAVKKAWELHPELVQEYEQGYRS